MLCFCFLELGTRPSVFTEFKLNQVNLPLVWIQFLEEAFKACAVSLGSNQEGSVVLAVILRSRPCSDSLSALPTSV